MSRPTGRIHFANADKSKRLLRLLGVLSDGRRYSTRTLQRLTGGCAIHTDVSELRLGAGYKIKCAPAWDYKLGKNVFWYSMGRK